MPPAPSPSPLSFPHPQTLKKKAARKVNQHLVQSQSLKTNTSQRGVRGGGADQAQHYPRTLSSPELGTGREGSPEAASDSAATNSLRANTCFQ